MTFAQRRNRLTTHFSERIHVVKRRISVYVCVYVFMYESIFSYVEQLEKRCRNRCRTFVGAVQSEVL